jgi:peptidoglycan hydrolase CwlO-like protein
MIVFFSIFLAIIIASKVLYHDIIVVGKKWGVRKEEGDRLMRRGLVVVLAMFFLTACNDTANSNELEFQSQIGDLQSTIDDMETRISDLESQNEELTKQNEDFQNNLDDVLSRLDNLELNQSY